jgi:hypothetical protein
MREVALRSRNVFHAAAEVSTIHQEVRSHHEAGRMAQEGTMEVVRAATPHVSRSMCQRKTSAAASAQQGSQCSQHLVWWTLQHMTQGPSGAKMACA